jgi:Copper type II ascorbate-dependent monooxygenase, C-terminal domain
MEFSGYKAPSHSVGVATGTVVLAVLFALVSTEITSAEDKTVPTFSKDVAPILFKNCVRCHHAGELASRLPLISYETVRPRAELIKQKVVTREMPPWPADPARSLRFRNDARLSQQDIDTIVAWVNAGTPKGNDAELPLLPNFEDSWMHPQGLKPDLMISLPAEVQLPARGEIPYVRSLVQVPFSEDRWIVASQTRPSNFPVVHHMAVTEISLPLGMTPSDVNLLVRQMGVPTTMFDSPAVKTPSKPGQPEMLAIYTPGSTLEMYREGSAKLLKGGKNMYLIFNIHYETTGKPETDRSRVAFWFTPGPPEHQLFRVNGAGETILANGKELLTDDPGTKAEGTDVVIPPIPAFAENYELIGVTAYTEPIIIYQFQPHAHHRGKDFTYTVVYPDGREQILLSVPKYDHRWQMAYELETPLKLPAGSKLVVTAHYDNSKMNMHNPAPEKAVYFRDMNQSWDEMFTPFIQYSMDHQDPSKLSITTSGQREKEEANASPKQQGREQDVLEIGEVVGCLEAGPAKNWLLTSAGQPTASETEATSSAAVKAEEGRSLGSQRYELLGVGIFNPSSHKGEKVAVKGVLIRDSDNIRINVTSLQMVGRNCLQ